MAESRIGEHRPSVSTGACKPVGIGTSASFFHPWPCCAVRPSRRCHRQQCLDRHSGEITKMYEAELTNYGILPVAVTRCEFLNDTLSRGTMVAYGAERWNRTSGQWES